MIIIHCSGPSGSIRPPPFAVWSVLSKALLCEKFRQADIEARSHLVDVAEGYIGLPAFNAPDKGSVQLAELRKFILGQSLLSPYFPHPQAQCLARAGHDSRTPTFWIWEGVIPYLDRGAFLLTLAAAAARSAPGSKVAATYGEKTRVPRLFVSRIFAS